MDSIMGIWLEKRDAIDDGVSNPRGENLSRLSIVFTCISGFFVALRLLTRFSRGRQLGPDDALLVTALVLAICMAVTYNEEAINGFGLHTGQVNADHKALAFKWFFAAQILYKVATCFTKLSICVMYLRIFTSRKFHIAVYTVMAITVTYTLVAVMLTVFSCNPIEKAWYKTLPGSCLDSRKIWYSTSILIILTDAMIIILPVNEIRRLQLPLIKKVLLGGLFSLGIFVIACTVIRMITVTPETTASDQLFFQATSNSWTFVETNVGIICACLPVLRVPLSKSVRKMLGLRRKDTTNKSDSNHVYGLGTIGQISSRARTTEPDAEGGSIEELITDDNGIRVTRSFSTQVTGAREKMPSEYFGQKYPSRKVEAEFSVHSEE